MADEDIDIPPVGRALLDRIAQPESGGRYDVRFDGTGKGATITDLSQHPNVAAVIPPGMPYAGQKSTAAGRYQFIHPTWEAQAQKLGLTDFSPASQDKAAWNLAKETYQAKTDRNLQADLESGNTAHVASALSSQWASLGGQRAVAPHPQLASAPPASQSPQTAYPPPGQQQDWQKLIGLLKQQQPAPQPATAATPAAPEAAQAAAPPYLKVPMPGDQAGAYKSAIQAILSGQSANPFARS